MERKNKSAFDRVVQSFYLKFLKLVSLNFLEMVSITIRYLHVSRAVANQHIQFIWICLQVIKLFTFYHPRRYRHRCCTVAAITSWTNAVAEMQTFDVDVKIMPEK